MAGIEVAVVPKEDVDPLFCEKECAAGRIKGKCLVSGSFCKNPAPRIKTRTYGQRD
jgi:hypothetical protein